MEEARGLSSPGSGEARRRVHTQAQPCLDLRAGRGGDEVRIAAWRRARTSFFGWRREGEQVRIFTSHHDGKKAYNLLFLPQKIRPKLTLDSSNNRVSKRPPREKNQPIWQRLRIFSPYIVNIFGLGFGGGGGGFIIYIYIILCIIYIPPFPGSRGIFDRCFQHQCITPH